MFEEKYISRENNSFLSSVGDEESLKHYPPFYCFLWFDLGLEKNVKFKHLWFGKSNQLRAHIDRQISAKLCTSGDVILYHKFLWLLYPLYN